MIFYEYSLVNLKPSVCQKLARHHIEKFKVELSINAYVGFSLNNFRFHSGFKS
jgi:hypothetical protein